ncbi:hypothetical protein CC85DRAFT_15731 [Cutaneotrichosporon oleaginosum]|uniref:Uncharacterized protein n=1 Tax=Cutaneotrichosporon oleaginosum TaxID=879819 RepID=A0A0J1B928_9TREE|nr:uncharacterized protein CC85DRAFT_15731 [Cutaneotrichosporon oleaginosum]KLT44314.1 hypothetical protein CC85DRAFT_15731 [Cutaneotrichosporon oleaginosum]TXT07958.1 hypothetical protein COLE_04882 [Cutaneotrichosporon oleaginosum]
MKPKSCLRERYELGPLLLHPTSLDRCVWPLASGKSPRRSRGDQGRPSPMFGRPNTNVGEGRGLLPRVCLTPCLRTTSRTSMQPYHLRVGSILIKTSPCTASRDDQAAVTAGCAVLQVRETGGGESPRRDTLARAAFHLISESEKRGLQSRANPICRPCACVCVILARSMPRAKEH